MGITNPLMKKKEMTTENNSYAIRKGTAHRLMDVALLMANISQLKMVLDLGDEGHKYFHLLLVLIVLSLACQFVFALLVVISWSSKEADDEEAKSKYGVETLYEEFARLKEDDEKKELADKHEDDTAATGEEVIVEVGDEEPLHKPSEDKEDKKDKDKKHDKKDFRNELLEIASSEKNHKLAMERLGKLLQMVEYENRPKRRFTISLRTAEFLDRLTVFLVFMIIVINMFITGFGLQAPPSGSVADVKPPLPNNSQPTQ